MLIDHVQLVGTAYSTHDAVSYIVLSSRCCFVSIHYTTGIGAHIVFKGSPDGDNYKIYHYMWVF